MPPPWPWIVAVALLLLAIPAAIVGIPILAHQNQGLSRQDAAPETWPRQATRRGMTG